MNINKDIHTIHKKGVNYKTCRYNKVDSLNQCKMLKTLIQYNKKYNIINYKTKVKQLFDMFHLDL